MSEYINIGLDFGTHQTKVCIENSTDQRNITYSFLKFFEGTPDETYFLPSIVQINKDNTLLYGKADPRLAKSYKKSLPKEKKPKLVLPPEPKEEKLPERPKTQSILSFSEFVSKRTHKKVSNIEAVSYKKLKNKQRKKLVNQISSEASGSRLLRIEYDKYVKEIERKNKKIKEQWIHEYYHKEIKYKERLAAWEKECEKLRAEYEKQLRKWSKPDVVTKYQIYRYFKIASFSQGYFWEMAIDPIKISIWYITYVLFQIYKVVDEDSSVQFGIPQSISNVEHSKWQIRNAEVIFYSAFRLYQSFKSEKEFLAATITELNERTRSYESVEPDYSTEPGLLILPEAFASLVTLTKEGKISRGLTLLMDIGGGSTDISLFNVIEVKKSKHHSEYTPNISHILSVHKGLNNLFLLYLEDNDNLTIEEARDIFQNNPEEFEEYIYEFSKELATDIHHNIYEPLLKASSKSGITSTQLKDALYSRPVIYTGGGSVYDSFIVGMHVFTDPISISKDFISVKNITNKDLTDTELSILSVSYGLAVPQMREPEMTPLGKLFEHIKMVTDDKSQYVHGISDVE